MAKHRTIDQALDMFDAWEAAALERRQREGQRTLKDLLKGLERRTGVRLHVKQCADGSTANRGRAEIRTQSTPRRKRRAAR